MLLIYCGSKPAHEAELICSPKSTKSCTLKAARLPSSISMWFSLRLTQVSRSFREVFCCELAGIHCHIQAEFFRTKNILDLSVAFWKISNNSQEETWNTLRSFSPLISASLDKNDWYGLSYTTFPEKRFWVSKNKLTQISVTSDQMSFLRTFVKLK